MTRTQGLIIWLLVACFAVALFLVNPLADIAARFSRDVTLGSGALYTTLRVANSVMSVARDADISGGVGVASVTASPGQLLQPVINTIERLVDLLFGLAIVSGILSLILVPVAKVASVALGACALFCAGLTLTTRQLPSVMDRLAKAVLVLGVLGAVLLPASYTIAFYAGDAITDRAWTNATEVFDRMRGQQDLAGADVDVVPPVETLSPTDRIPPAEDGMFDRLGSAFTGTLQAASDMAETAAANAQVIQDGVAISADLFTASIGIATAYLVKLLVLPVLILAAFLYLLRAATR
ncbi:hypothetical protein ASE36_11575 [Rhizobium sp. Root274]|uniref:hypothetical protein n=1 Tax=unclassified Rhizobium TaxID=2613769 RepID=UPI000712B59B|nr:MULTISPECIES: hypothetical protein [unclassified Rhizobium]KQW29105.1 hypothetical protein ASC71_11595 [Rhizobium sp. Root1240]KRD29301.1 hypothetical protein ASE36_11575 [Rhizobium sp. Root274]